MTEKIKSRWINRGDDCESEWPPLMPSGAKGLFYWDNEAKMLKEGLPPTKIQKFGEAPYIIGDSIEPYYHPAAEKIISSRSELKQVDKACGTITTDKLIPADKSYTEKYKKKRDADIKESILKSVAKIDNNEAPLSEETKALCNIQNRIVSEALNFDAFNVAGRKNDRRGKKYRRK